MRSKNIKTMIFAVIAVLLLGTAAVCVIRGENEKEVTSFAPEFEETQERPENENSQSGTEAGIEIPGYKSITIPAGTTDVKVDLMNPENNQVYFQISFYLPDTEETIYTSKLIKPGQHIYEITLEHAMEKGEYPLTVKYATYSADEAMLPKNGADVNCTLIVE